MTYKCSKCNSDIAEEQVTKTVEKFGKALCNKCILDGVDEVDEYALMFNMNTGKIVSFEPSFYNSNDNMEWLTIHDGYTPYYTIEGKYFGCKCRNEYRTHDGKYFGEYNNLN